MIATDLVGEYVTIPSEGDAGWIRAVFNKIVSEQVAAYPQSVFSENSYVWVLVQRNNSSNDLAQYPIDQIVLKGKSRSELV
jgi:hypothetical protein